MKFKIDQTGPNTLPPLPDQCFLCPRRAIVVGVIFPSDPAMRSAFMVLAPAMKEPSVMYGLCDEHFGKDDTMRRVEDKIMDEAKRQRQ